MLSSKFVRALSIERNWSARCFSSTASVLKKRSGSKAKANASFEDAFANDADDLFSLPMKRNVPQPTFSSSSSQVARTARRSRDPSEMFKEQFAYVSSRVGQSPSITHPQVRANALRRLLHYSQNAAHLERLAELLVAWRNGGRTVDQATVLEFVDRCLKWKPKLLIDIFSNRQRYGLDIPDLHEARRILRRIVLTSGSLPENEGLQHAVAFAALYPSYGLPPATSDLTSCVLLAQSCCHSASANPQSKDALASLMPALLKAFSTSGESQEAPKINSPDDLKNLGKGSDANSVAYKRESGFTQTEAVEWKWINMGVQDVLTSLKKYWPESAERYSRTLNELLQSRLGAVHRSA